MALHAGDREKFAAFYTSTEARVRAYARRCLFDPSLADDLVQEAYVRLISSARADLPIEQRTLYLFRIVGNLVRDHWKSSRRFESLPAEGHDTVGNNSRHTSGPRFSAPEIDLSDVWRVLEKLPMRHRQILWLAYVEEFDHIDIAQAMGVTRLSVKVLLHRARKGFVQILERKK